MSPSTQPSFEKAAVIGAGAWGTALAEVCARAGLSVTLAAREPELIDAINNRRENSLFLPGVTLHPNITAVTDLGELSDCDLVLAVAPAQFLRSSLGAYAPHARPDAALVLCAKGVEQGTMKLMTEVASEAAPGSCTDTMT